MNNKPDQLGREETLVNGLKNKDQAAFAQVYDTYSPALYGVLLRIVGSEQAAGQLLQESLLSIWNSIDSYQQSDQSLFTWMLNITRNLAISHIRPEEPRQSTGTTLSSSSYGQPSPATDFAGVRERIPAFELEKQQVVDLLYFEGCTQAEASEALGVPADAVKTELRAAIKCMARTGTNG